ncbi:MAG: FecR domain-containing protein, partial [Spirochaetia bacterium]|nr:FecR domain-containing protein [Spirochaetia bacterium]
MRHLVKWILILALVSPQIFAEVENLRVGRMIGSVRFALRGNAELMTLRPGQSVPANSSVVTGSNSSVDLHFPDGSVISVAPNTRFRLDRLASVSNTQSGSFGIDYGKILSKISKLNKARDLQFTTPMAIAGVRGTIFGIDVAQAGEAKLLVTEGAVAFGNQEVPAGSMAVAN